MGDTVAVPGDMHGLVKFIGPVAGKRGTFAGVQLATEYAPRGKNSGDVDGKYYFKTSIPGSGIFLPLEKAVKKPGGLGVRPSPGPGTPTRLSSFNQGGRTPGIAKPNFSQSIGPGVRTGAASPALKPPLRRESLPRPTSPLRKVNTPTPKTMATPKPRPSGIGLAKSTNGSAYRPGQRPSNAFAQSLRQGSSTPSNAATSPSLGPESSFDESLVQEAESTPTPTPHINRAGVELHVEKYETKIRELNDELNDARRQLRDQNVNFAEMERNFNELQKLLAGLEESQTSKRGRDDDDDELPRDVMTLRDVVREKNDRIKLLTAEFDANRADFRSTIDTLEMASSETERVYEKRVDELLEEVRNLQDRSEDVESVAQQLKQLEELVHELEEDLEDARRGEEDARRGEAEARSEVEFLRGEVERSRSELRRERERLKTEDQLNGYSADHVQELEAQLNGKDDEIRGLKAIIQSLNVDSPKTNGYSKGNNRNDSQITDDSLHQQIRDLETLLQQKSAHEEELANEVKQLRNSVTLSKFPLPGSAFGIHTAIRPGGGGHSRENSGDLDRKHLSTGSQRTVVLGAKGHQRKESQQISEAWHDTTSRGASPVKQQDYIPDMALGVDRDRARSDDGATDVSASSAALWCEICEEGGHDILTCSNMFGPGKKSAGSVVESPKEKKNGKEVPAVEADRDAHNLDPDRPAPLMSRKSTNNSITPTSSQETATHHAQTTTIGVQDDQDEDLTHTASQPPIIPTPATSKPPIEGTGAQAGMYAGKTSGVIDPEKWCALCERDGHDSVDCPLEEAF